MNDRYDDDAVSNNIGYDESMVKTFYLYFTIRTTAHIRIPI